MQQADVIETHARHKGILDEVLPRFGKLLGVFIIVTRNREDFAARHIDGHAIRDLKPRLFALPLMLEAKDVQVAVALVDLAITVFWVVLIDCHALLRGLLALRRVWIEGLRCHQVDVAIDAEDLKTLHRV